MKKLFLKSPPYWGGFRCGFLLTISFLCSNLLVAQQAWTSPKGKFYSQIGFTYLVYDGYNKSDIEIIPLNRKITHNALQGYIQYGITDKLMVTGVLPLTFTNSTLTSGAQPAGLSDGKLNGLGNIQTALTYRFYEKNGIVLSGKLNAILPTAQKNVATGLRTGDDAFGFAPSLLAGYGHSKFFTSMEFGGVLRNNNYSNQTLAYFQLGKFMGKKQNFLMILHSALRFSSKNGTYDDGNSKYTATYLNDLRYIAYGLKLGYKVTPKIMAWSDIRFWASSTEKIGGRTDALGLFPGLTFSVSYQN
jgi:hypothetical protein